MEQTYTKANEFVLHIYTLQKLKLAFIYKTDNSEVVAKVIVIFSGRMLLLEFLAALIGRGCASNQREMFAVDI